MALIDRMVVERDMGVIGYNDLKPPEFLPKKYLADALNCFCGTGEIVKRKGSALIANDIGANKPCQGLKGVRLANGTTFFVAVFNGVIYKWTGSGNWTSLGGTLSTTAQIDIVVANNAVYFFDGVNTVPKYDGTTLSTVAAIPLGLYAKWFHNQLHVAGISATPNTLQSSDIGNPENFSSGAWSSLAINPNDGDYISGLSTLKDNLFIFKTKRVWSASGFGTAALTLSSISELVTGVGTLSHRSIINTGNELLYISFFGNIPHFRSIARTLYGVIVDNGIISQDIETTMKGLNTAQLSQVAATFDGRYVWFAVPNGSSTYNNMILTYDTILKGWTRHTGINASVFDSFSISGTPTLYSGEASNSSKAYQLNTGTSDNGTAINFQMTTRRYGGDETEHKNKFRWLYVRAKEIGNYNVTIDYSVDGFTYANLGTLNLTGTGAIFDGIVLDTSRLGSTDVKRKRFTIPKSRNYYVQFQMYDTSATSSVTIRNWALISEKRHMIKE